MSVRRVAIAAATVSARATPTPAPARAWAVATMPRSRASISGVVYRRSWPVSVQRSIASGSVSPSRSRGGRGCTDVTVGEDPVDGRLELLRGSCPGARARRRRG